MERSKGDWRRPEMTTLVRRNPEESVLTSCKGNNTHSGHSDVNLGCWYNNAACSACSSPFKS